MEFIGREKELARLKKVYQSKGYEGVLLYGRRRIGKSELVKRSMQEESCKRIYFECTKVSEASNTKAFCEAIAHVFGIPVPAYTHFADALEYVFLMSEKEPIILAIDEYPYLRAKIEACDSVFQKVIDTHAMSCRMKFILCGSAIEVMCSLDDRDNPLYNRFGTTITLTQMNYYESARFYPDFTPEDKVRIYSVFGGVPYFNQFVDDSLSVKENLLELVASPGARLDGEPSRLLESELSRLENANEVFLAIAGGARKFSDILSQAHVSSSPTLADVLTRLMNMDVVKKDNPINVNSQNRTIYTISDRLLLFWYKYIFPRVSAFAIMPPERFFSEFIETDFENSFVPHAYEEIARQYLVRMNLEGKSDPVLYQVGKYYYDNPKERKNGEFDVVTESKDGFDFYEVKFTKKPVDDSVVREETFQLERAGVKVNRMGFFSRNGFNVTDPEKYILIDLEDVYR